MDELWIKKYSWLFNHQWYGWNVVKKYFWFRKHELKWIHWNQAILLITYSSNAMKELRNTLDFLTMKCNECTEIKKYSWLLNHQMIWKCYRETNSVALDWNGLLKGLKDHVQLLTIDFSSIDWSCSVTLDWQYIFLGLENHV